MNSIRGKSCHCPLRAILYGLVLVLFPARIPSAFGQASIIPLMQEIDVNRGGKTRFQLQIANRGTDSLAFTMGAYDLSISEDGIPTANPQKTERSCVDWITFTPATFELAADEVQVVEGLVHAPIDAEGGYFSFIAAEFRLPLPPFSFEDQQKTKAQIELSQGVSSTLLITVRSSKNTVQLEPDSLVLSSGHGSTSEMMLGLPASGKISVWQAALMVANTGTIHTIATGEISLWTENARLVERAPLTAGRGFVLPGKKRVFRAEGTRPLADGVYLAKVQIRTKQGRLVQGNFPYSILNGEAHPGAASEAVRALLKASSPSFSLSNRMLDYKITPGGKRTQGISLKNYGRDTLAVRARVVTWSLDDSGRVVLRPDPDILVRPCVSWLQISPNPILIPPNLSSAVKVTVTAPPELDGEYYAAVVFQSSEADEQLPTEFELPRTLMITVSSAQALEYKAEIESFHCNPVSRLMRVFVVNALNTGNVHCFASGKLEIYDLKFNLLFEPIRFGGPNDYILPDRVRGYAVPCPGTLEPGTYEAVVMLDYHDGATPAVSKIRFESRGK